MDIRYFKKYISIKTKKHWFLIGNVYGKGFTVVNWNKQGVQTFSRLAVIAGRGFLYLYPFR